MIATAPGRAARRWTGVDRAGGGLAADLGLYALSAVFAAVTAATSTLAPHRAWGAVAVIGYAAAAIVVVGQLAAGRRTRNGIWSGTRARAALTVLTWFAVAVLPLVIQAGQRADGHLDRAQEEVVVVEDGGARLLEDGTPYLGPDAITALPEPERLLGYLPYQPGMALFGVPRAAFGVAWWTDARIWFAVATAVALLLAVGVLGGRGPVAAAALVRAVQAATVLPLCALTLATGGDDLPVLALCLLALALSAGSRFGGAGVAAGLAGALKLFAWPVTLVLLVHTAALGRGPGLSPIKDSSVDQGLGVADRRSDHDNTSLIDGAKGGRGGWRGRWRGGTRFALGALGIPVAALVPAVLVDADAAAENVLRFPLGRGLVDSPAQSPFPGHLVATGLPGGRAMAAGLLVAAGVAIAVLLVRRPPRTASSAALFCASGLLAAILLMPSTRFGYLLYPAAFAAWAPALRGAPADPPGAGEIGRPAAAVHRVGST